MKVIGSVAARNAITREVSPDIPLTIDLRNIRINGTLRGCSGFIRNDNTGAIIYLTTEESCYGPLQNKVMYRTAVSMTDYTGGRNQWANASAWAQEVANCLS